MSAREVLDLIGRGQRFLVACHRRPDADAFGSALGFAAILRAAGKETVVFVPDELPVNLCFLGRPEVQRVCPCETAFDATFVMDTASATLLPDGLPGSAITGPLVVVDHHAAHDDVGDVVVRDVDACATGEVVMDLAAALGVRPVPAEAATPLYAAIVADTGGFRYPSTSARTLRLGAELLDSGADPWQVAYELFEGWDPERLALLGAVIEGMTVVEDGALAMMRVTRELLARCGADDDMVEGLVNYGRMLRGVEIAVLLWEFPSRSGDGVDTKLSLRSRGRIDVAKIAVEFDGGGHRAAAGAQVAESMDAVEARVIEVARRLLASTPADDCADAGGTPSPGER